MIAWGISAPHLGIAPALRHRPTGHLPWRRRGRDPWHGQLTPHHKKRWRSLSVHHLTFMETQSKGIFKKNKRQQFLPLLLTWKYQIFDFAISKPFCGQMRVSANPNSGHRIYQNAFRCHSGGRKWKNIRFMKPMTPEACNITIQSDRTSHWNAYEKRSR